jgi:hypothetical protein
MSIPKAYELRCWWNFKGLLQIHLAYGKKKYKLLLGPYFGTYQNSHQYLKGSKCKDPHISSVSPCFIGTTGTGMDTRKSMEKWYSKRAFEPQKSRKPKAG